MAKKSKKSDKPKETQATETAPAEDETPIVIVSENTEKMEVTGIDENNKEVKETVEMPKEEERVLSPAELKQKEILALRQGVATIAADIRLLENQIRDCKGQMADLGAQIANL